MFPYTNSSSTTTTSLEGPFLHFPSPFLDDVDDGLMSHLLSHHHHHNPPPPEERNGHGGVHKKRVKRDRHTKICTAQGLRDRRMRLSVKVARKFFDLQDMLDFDKASKTIDWLLINSESAIQELAARSSGLGCNNQFSVSSSASVSEVTETNKETEIMRSVVTSTNKPQEMRKRKRTCYHKVVNVNPFAKERRDNARARARERTRDKMIQRSQSQNNESNQLKTSKNQDSVNGANHNLEFQGFAGNEGRIEPGAGCYAMTSKRTSLGNCVQVQNIIPNDQEHSCILQPSNSAIMMTNSSNGGQYWNPSSIFGITPNNGQEQQNPIPKSIFMNTSALEIGMITSPLFTPTNSNIGFHSHFHGNHFL